MRLAQLIEIFLKGKNSIKTILSQHMDITIIKRETVSHQPMNWFS